ncbi:hypothetical protein L7F22_023241 [Adiantum nelumboides]|nr:hypothetical protein [Adiantum nelumboides]
MASALSFLPKVGKLNVGLSLDIPTSCHLGGLRCQASLAPTLEHPQEAVGEQGKLTAGEKISIGVLGASGYTGSEIVRLLATHPYFRITLMTADRKAGQSLASVFPHLVSQNLPNMVAVNDADFSQVDAVFCCLPHGTTQVKAEEEERGKSLPKDKGKAKVEDVDAMPIKRARQEEAAMSETGERRKSKENGESSSKKKSKPRRKLTIKDFALGESSQPYNLVDDISVQGPKITWPQLLHLAPKVRRQWTKMVSTRRVKTKAMGLVSGRNLQDITPVLNAYVKGQRVSNVYVD